MSTEGISAQCHCSVVQILRFGAIDKEIASLNRRVDLLLRYPGKKHAPRADNAVYLSEIPRSPALVSVAALVAVLAFPGMSLATEEVFASDMLKLANVLAAGITGLVSSLFWMISARDGAIRPQTALPPASVERQLSSG